MKKFIAIVVLSFLLIACGGGGGGEGPAPAAPTPDIGTIQHGGTPADTMFLEQEAMCKRHGGYHERTTKGSMNTADASYYEVRCADGTKIVAGFNNKGERING